MARGRQPQSDPEDTKADLMAMLAASRELGPEMDKAVIDSYLGRHKDEATNQPAQQAQGMVPQQQTQALDSNQIAPMVFGGFLVIAFIAALVVSQGKLWWLIFCLPAFGWGGRRWYGYGHDRHDRLRARAEYRAARDALKLEYIRNLQRTLPYGGGYGIDAGQRGYAPTGEPHGAGYDYPQVQQPAPPSQYPAPPAPSAPSPSATPPAGNGSQTTTHQIV